MTPKPNVAFDLEDFSTKGFDRGASSLKLALWIVCSSLLFKPWYSTSPMRRGLLRLFGASIGRGVVIRKDVQVHFPWKLTVGDFSWIGDEARILNLESVVIGSHTCISQQAFLCTGSHDRKARDFKYMNLPILVGSHCWIALRAVILPGVTIRDCQFVPPGEVIWPERSQI